MSTQQIIESWENGVEPYRQLEIVADSLRQCSAIRSPKQLHETIEECEKRLRKLIWFQIGKTHREKGIPCCHANGSYLEGWYSVDTTAFTHDTIPEEFPTS